MMIVVTFLSRRQNPFFFKFVLKFQLISGSILTR